MLFSRNGSMHVAHTINLFINLYVIPKLKSYIHTNHAKTRIHIIFSLNMSKKGSPIYFSPQTKNINNKKKEKIKEYKNVR